MKLLLPLLLLSVLTSSYGYKVLVIVPVPSRSHGALGKGIVDSLLKAGHQVTWASPFTDWKPHKNLRLIDVSETLQLIGDHDMTSQKANDINFVKEFSKNVTILTLSNKQLMDTVTKENFDAIVTEWFFSDIFSGFAAVQQVPQVLLCGTLINPMLEGVVDDVRSIPTVPLMFFDFTLPLNFWQRVLNTYVYLSLRIGLMLEQSSEAARYESVFSPIASSRGVALPAFPSAVHNVSILFVNSHPSIAPALSLPPNVIDVAGYHIDEATALPKDIQSILDSSPQGVVYFSMGSVVKSAALPQRTREDLISILGSIPYTVLWKFEEEIQGLPKNIIVKKWWPQASVLAHPNIRLFITHGGMLSTLEAVHNGVPLLAIPVFGDQPSNARRAERAGYAIAVPFAVDMGPTLKVALDKILSDDSYYKQAKLLSTLFNKRPVHPTKLISHYVELAIESKGAYHLRSKTHLYSWYQRWMVDQLALLVLILSIFYATARRIFRMISGEKTQEKKKKVKKN